jgi:predicted GNAT family acetyltransferase
MSYDVTHNAEAGRFEIRVDDHVAVLDYVLSNGRMAMVHTGVPPQLEGKGYGGQLAKAALEYAKGAGLRVAPECSFVRVYIERHPEYAALVD